LQQGYLAEDRGQVDVALDLYRTVLGMANERADNYDVASVHLAMAWPYILRKEYRRALRIIDAARTQFAELGDRANDGMIALRNGQARAGLGEHARAMAEYGKAEVALQSSRNRRYQALLQARRWQWTAMALAGILLLLLGGLVVRQLTRMRRLREMAATDPLTGVANRRSIEQHGDAAIVRARASGLPLCVLALDVDHFKTVNDNHGHPCGDQVLARIAGTCRDALRHFDLLGRTGGEEFLVLLPDTRLERALSIAERLRSTVEALDFSDIADGLATTISIGVVELRASDAGLQELIARADSALYRAKGNGRNRVEADRG